MLEIPGKYAKLPLSLVGREDLSASAKILWGVLAHHQSEPGAFVSVGGKPIKQGTLVVETGLARRTLQRTLDELASAGLLEIIRRQRKGRPTLLRVHVPDEGNVTCAKMAQVPPATCATLAQVPAPPRRRTRAILAPDPRHSGAPSFVDTHNKTGSGQPPPAPVAPCIEHTPEATWPAVLVQAYLGRTVRDVTFADAAASITDHLRGGLPAEMLAAYLDATPHVRAWPSELAGQVRAWSDGERLKTFRAELTRIRRDGLVEAVRAADAGEDVGRVQFVDPEADPPHLVIEVDRTPAALSRDAQIAGLRSDLANLPAAVQGSAYERGRRGELKRLEAGGEPGRPERCVERIDVTTREDLRSWTFRPGDATLPGLDDAAVPGVAEGSRTWR